MKRRLRMQKFKNFLYKKQCARFLKFFKSNLVITRKFERKKKNVYKSVRVLQLRKLKPYFNVFHIKCKTVP